MKKRKPPVMLITLLVVMVGIVAVYNLMQSGVISPDAQKHDEHAAPQQASVTPASERQSMRQAMQRQARTPGAPDPSGAPPDKRPTVLIEKQKPYKPMPNESSTSTQWYTPESAKSGKPTK